MNFLNKLVRKGKNNIEKDEDLQMYYVGERLYFCGFRRLVIKRIIPPILSVLLH